MFGRRCPLGVLDVVVVVLGVVGRIWVYVGGGIGFTQTLCLHLTCFFTRSVYHISLTKPACVQYLPPGLSDILPKTSLYIISG